MNVKELKEKVQELQTNFILGHGEAIQLALGIEHNELLEEQNEILKQAFMVCTQGLYPTSLEEIRRGVDRIGHILYQKD